jgi:hypothetical protein
LVHKKREVRLFFTLLEGFAIPYTVEKQPKSTPDIYIHHTMTGAEWILHIYGTFIVAATTVYEMLRRFRLVANNVNKRLLIMLYDVPFQSKLQSAKHHGGKSTA